MQHYQQIQRSSYTDIDVIFLVYYISDLNIMTQPDNIKRRISKMLQNLSIEIDRVGLADKFQYKITNDPWVDLQNAHSSLVGIVEDVLSVQNQSDFRQNNEQIVLDCLRSFINIHLELSKFSKMLYEGNYSLEVYKSYRKLYQQISKTSNWLYQYQSNNQDFLKQKEQLISEKLQICEQIQSNGTLSQENREKNQKQKLQNNQIEEQAAVIEGLQKEIDMLNQMIRQNDEEFTQQIQRYNNTLFDLQQTVREYELRMDKVREYQATIDDLQHKVIRLKQQKYRDDMLIDNMSKKIRLYEKERGGVQAFLSPRGGNYARKNVVSPGNRVFNQSLMGSHGSMAAEPKLKNYYGQRLISH